MPTLFISYKRGTVAIPSFVERLRTAHYRLWFDKNDIQAGQDWQQAIDLGIEKSDVVVVALTPAACESEYVRYEVQRAKQRGKPIFPVKLEPFDDQVFLPLVGVEHLQYIDFTEPGVDVWERKLNELFAALRRQGLGVTGHDMRQVVSHPTYALHQRYLTKLIRRIGFLDLAQINPNASQRGVPLEKVYVESPTELSVTIAVHSWKLVDWWIERRSARRFRPTETNVGRIRLRPEELHYETAPLEALVAQLDDLIEFGREKFPDLTTTDTSTTWRNGIHHDAYVLTLQDIAAACSRLVVLGLPGSGKSTFVRHLALRLAAMQLDPESDALKHLGNWPHGALTPVYVELRHFVNSPHFPPIDREPDENTLWTYLRSTFLEEEELTGYADDLHQDLEQGYAVLILDGLDEVPYPFGRLKDRQRQLQALATDLNGRYRKSRIIVTSRPYAYEGWRLPGFESVNIADFEERHRIELARKLYQAADLGEREADFKARALNEQLKTDAIELRDRPLFLTLMATIFLRSGEDSLPTRRGELYRQSILLLLTRWTQTKPDAPSLQELLGMASPDDLYDRLAELAYEIHAEFGERAGTPDIPSTKLEHHLFKLGRQKGSNILGLYSYLSENAGVIVSLGQNVETEVFRFAHRSFQEYLAASHLAKLDFAQVRRYIQEQPHVWREPCTLVGDVLVETGREPELWRLLMTLLDRKIPPDIADEESRWWSVWLAAKITEQQNLYQVEPDLTNELIISLLRDWLTLLVTRPSILTVPERADCGRCLGLIGDQRKGVGLNAEGLPDIDWVEISGGTFIFQEGQQVSLPAFYISRYPITCAQFQVFLEAEDGFQSDVWWEDLVRHHPQLRTRTRYIGNYPRDRISWHDAVAFCRWLSAMFAFEITLPTEVQWEKAARGTEGRLYPWGNEYISGYANINETIWNAGPYDLGSTCAVGLYPQGVSPYGVHDMSGNIWEWCLNRPDQPQLTDMGGEQPRALRGGSWDLNAKMARTTYRGGSYPDRQSDNRGFRVVCKLPLST